MTEVDAVHKSTEPTRRARYRHGDLHNALLAAGIELARDGGPDAVVLREATRRTGVAPNAAYRHFADRGALLDAVRDAALSQLARAMETEQAAVPAGADPVATARARLRGVGAGYLRFARQEPGLFRTAFTSGGVKHLPEPGAEPEDTAPAAFALLNAALDDLAAVGVLSAAQRSGAEFVAWSAVHGLSMLVLDGQLREVDAPTLDWIGGRLLDVVESGLRET